MQLFGTVILVCLLVVGSKCQQSGNDQAHLAIVDANNAFSTSLYQVLSRQWGNLVVSPLSVSTVLAMAWLGAGGETARQLGAGLQLPESRSQVEAGYRTLLSSLQSTNAMTLEIANKMYVQQGFQIKDNFYQTAVRNFLSEVEKVDFARNPKSARMAINKWVEERTKNKIKDLVAPGVLGGNTLLVLINAIYFKGDWLNAFSEDVTTPMPFRLSSRANIKVPMMMQSQVFSYGDFPEHKFKAIKLPYQGGVSSMLLILPHDVEGISSLEAGLASLNLRDITSKMVDTQVNVFLPRFKIEKTTDLQRTLLQLGIIDIFQYSANFTGITDSRIYVSKVLQKAFIEVNEKGTVAAAATEVGFDFRFGSPSPLFNADHPFLFFILDDRTGAILFIGRVSQPRS